MKKSFVIFLSLLILGIGGTLWIQTSLLSVKDKVTFEDKVLYGDPALVEGMEVHVEANYDEQIFWDTSYTFGSPPKIHTEYNYYHTKQNKEDIRLHQGSFPSFDMDISLYPHGFNSNKKSFESPHGGLNDIFMDMYNSIGSDGYKIKEIQLKDYYDYYPLNITLHFQNGDHYYYTDTQFANNNITYEDSDLEHNYWLLQNYFSIPVLEEDIRTLTMAKSEGVLDNMGLHSPEGMSDIWLNTYSLTHDNSFYITFNTYAGIEDEDDNPVYFDTTHIPGGYGIYRLPYDMEMKGNNTQYTPRFEELSNVYPLDPSIELFQFTLTEDESRFILTYLAEENGQTVTKVEIIDAATMEQVQIFTLDPIPQADGSLEILLPSECYTYDDFFVVNCSFYYVAVFSLGEDNLYHLEYIAETDAYPGVDIWNLSWPYATMDYKEGKLAIACHHTTQSYETCGFVLAVFDKDGLQYYSTHESSLGKGAGRINYNGRGKVWPTPSALDLPYLSRPTEAEQGLFCVEWE